MAEERWDLVEFRGAAEPRVQLARQLNGNESIAEEARVVEAAALDALGKHDEAVTKMKALSKETVTALARLGPPRVRGIAKDALSA